jgi:hypothetical protein
MHPVSARNRGLSRRRRGGGTFYEPPNLAAANIENAKSELRDLVKEYPTAKVTSEAKSC